MDRRTTWVLEVNSRVEFDRRAGGPPRSVYLSLLYACLLSVFRGATGKTEILKVEDKVDRMSPTERILEQGWSEDIQT
jgi:hypothetical protein